MLIECLVYIAVLFVVLGVAYSVFDKFQDSSRDLKRNAADIVKALQMGERWRADVRAAIGPVRLEEVNGEQLLYIPQTNSIVVYQVERGSVWRWSGPQTSPLKLLPKVKSSRLYVDERSWVKSLRWEVELPSRRQVARVRPLFTFQAVINSEGGMR